MHTSTDLIEQAEDAERALGASDHPDDREALEARAAELRTRAAILDANLSHARAH